MNSSQYRWIAAGIAALMALGIAATASGEQRRVITAKERQVGFGVALAPSNALPVPVAIYIPINVSKQFRLEPEFGFTVSTLNDADGSETSTQQFRIGTGAFFVQKLGKTVRLYVGPRITVLLTTIENSPESGDTVETSNTSFNVGGSLGGEYFFTSRFSMGAEAQINFTSIGETEVDGEGTGGDGSVIGTNSLVFFRTWF